MTKKAQCWGHCNCRSFCLEQESGWITLFLPSSVCSNTQMPPVMWHSWITISKSDISVTTPTLYSSCHFPTSPIATYIVGSLLLLGSLVFRVYLFIICCPFLKTRTKIFFSSLLYSQHVQLCLVSGKQSPLSIQWKNEKIAFYISIPNIQNMQTQRYFLKGSGHLERITRCFKLSRHINQSPFSAPRWKQICWSHTEE